MARVYPAKKYKQSRTAHSGCAFKLRIVNPRSPKTARPIKRPRPIPTPETQFKPDQDVSKLILGDSHEH